MIKICELIYAILDAFMRVLDGSATFIDLIFTLFMVALFVVFVLIPTPPDDPPGPVATIAVYRDGNIEVKQ